MPDHNIQVLSTRIIDRKLIENAAAGRIVIDEVPFIDIKLLDPAILKIQLMPFSGLHVNMVFTSANAVRAVAAPGIDHTNWNIYCISGTTKAAAAAAFPQASIKATAENGHELAGYILSGPVTGKVVFCCGNRRRDELPVLLSKNGMDVHEIICYRTTLTPVRVSKDYKAILFFSPSGVESYLKENIIDSQVALFSLGKTTAAALWDYGRQVIVADKPDVKILIDKLVRYFQADPDMI